MQEADKVRKEVYGVGRVKKPKRTLAQILNSSNSKGQIKPNDITIDMLNPDQVEMERLLDEKISKVEDRFMKQLK